MSIDQALAAAQAWNLDETTQLLLAAWQQQPSAQLAETLERVSASNTKDSINTRLKAGHEAWISRGTAPKPEDVQPLLDSLALGTKVRVMERLALLEGWPDDPRVALHLAKMVEKPPFTGQGFWVCWREVFTILEGRGDALVHTRLEQAQTAPRPIPNQAMATRFPNRLTRTLNKIAKNPARKLQEPDSHTQQTLASIVEVLDTREGHGDQLLQAIYANQDDPTLRYVYADYLLEQGDERGEFIQLQLADTLTKTQQRRLRGLEKRAHRWLGPLATVVQNKDLVFEGGFLVGCKLLTRAADAAVAELIGHPAWQTVRKVELGPYSPQGGPPTELVFNNPTMTSLREVLGIPQHEHGRLFEGGPWPFEVIGVDAVREPFVVTGLPEVRGLVLESHPWSGPWAQTPPTWLLEGLPQLEELVVHVPGGVDVAPFVSWWAQLRGLGLGRFNVLQQNKVAFAGRAGDGLSQA